jgi:hypothetical protein
MHLQSRRSCLLDDGNGPTLLVWFQDNNLDTRGNNDFMISPYSFSDEILILERWSRVRQRQEKSIHHLRVGKDGTASCRLLQLVFVMRGLCQSRGGRDVSRMISQDTQSSNTAMSDSSKIQYLPPLCVSNRMSFTWGNVKYEMPIFLHRRHQHGDQETRAKHWEGSKESSCRHRS